MEEGGDPRVGVEEGGDPGVAAVEEGGDPGLTITGPSLAAILHTGASGGRRSLPSAAATQPLQEFRGRFGSRLAGLKLELNFCYFSLFGVVLRSRPSTHMTHVLG